MSRKELCPKCHKTVNGLYENCHAKNPSNPWILRAFYCRKCDIVLLKNQIVYAQIEYIKKVY